MHRQPLLAAAGLLLALPGLALADGLLLPTGSAAPIHPTATAVETEITSQVATTTAELTFPANGSAHYRLLFPVPESASVVGLAVRTGAGWQEAELSREAPTTPGAVETTPGQGLDPVLVSWLGDNGFLVNLPAASGGEVRVRLTYIEVLPYDLGEVTYTYPLLAPAGYPDPARASVRLAVDLRTSRDLAGFSAPGYAGYGTVEARDARHARLAYSLDGVTPAADFVFRYGVRQQGLFVHLLTHHESCEEDGFFLLVVEPPHDVADGDVIPKYFTFVVDTSGSMDGYKIRQAREAARFFVDNLNDEDRFDVVSFADDPEALFGDPAEVSPRNRSRAAGYIDGLYAAGGTDVDGALLEALDASFDRSFARLVVLLTDGRPTVGETRADRILSDVRAANRDDSRLFTFGIGGDVNRDLLTALAAENRGEPTFFGEHDDIAALLSGFFQRIDRPVLTDVSLDFGGLPVSALHPDVATDLFAGSQLLVLGRYSGAGRFRAALSGSLRGARQVHDLDLTFSACESRDNAFLPRLWAKARIDSLLAGMAGVAGEDPAAVAEVAELGTRYRIQTPYTSFGVRRDPAPDPSPAPGNNGGGNGGVAGGGNAPDPDLGYDYDYGQGDDSDYDWGGDWFGGDLADYEEPGYACQATPGGRAAVPPALLLLVAALGLVRRRRR